MVGIDTQSVATMFQNRLAENFNQRKNTEVTSDGGLSFIGRPSKSPAPARKNPTMLNVNESKPWTPVLQDDQGFQNKLS